MGLHKSSPASESSLDEGPLLSEVALGAVQEEYRGKSELQKIGSPLFTNGNYISLDAFRHFKNFRMALAIRTNSFQITKLKLCAGHWVHADHNHHSEDPCSLSKVSV